MKRGKYDDHSLIQALHESRKEMLPPDTKKRMMQAVLSSYEDDRVIQPEENRYKREPLSFTFRHMIPVLSLVIVLVLGTGTALAADRAKPGDFLFGVDQALERARLSFTLNTETKAKVAADIAEERQEEQQELEKENRLAALDEANRQVDEALGQASETLEQVREDIDDSDASERATDALKKAEEKLTNLQVRHQETIAKAVTALTEAEVKLYSTYALVKIELKDKKSSFRLETVDRKVIIREIAKRTGIADDAIRSVVKFETEDDGEKNTNTAPDERENENTNQENVNENTNRQNSDDLDDDNENVNSTKSQSAAPWKIEVRIRGQAAEIHAEKSGEKQEWSIATSNQAAILASVAARTGLTASEVARIWDLEAEED